MKKKALLIAVVAVMVLGVVGAWSLRAQETGWENKSGELSDVSVMSVFPAEPQRILVGSSGKILLSEDDQQSWRSVLFLKGSGLAVHAFAFNPRETQSVYAATSDGLWMSENAGKNWKRIYRGVNTRQNNCTSVAIAKGLIMIGTSDGVLRSLDKGRTWQRESGELARASVVSLSLDGKAENIYLITENAIYSFSVKQQEWGKRFCLSTKEDHRIQDDEENVSQEDEAVDFFTSLAVDPFLKHRVVVGTNRGLIESLDSGLTWNPMSEDGLVDRPVIALLFGRGSVLYCAAGRSLYQRVDTRWQDVQLNSSGARINELSLGKQGELFVATDKGIFQAVFNQVSAITPHTVVSEYLKKEPSIQKVQQAAIHYAEVEPEKVMLWRKQAAGRAVLPKVSATVGRDTTDFWHWESGSTTKINDDVLMRGRDSLDWGVTLSWDLGELIWTDAQTSIDVRSKLMVELRESVLDEVTKIYFERIRVKAELDNCAIEDRKKLFEKELKLQELTASLDALTGQFFSNAITKK